MAAERGGGGVGRMGVKVEGVVVEAQERGQPSVKGNWEKGMVGQ